MRRTSRTLVAFLAALAATTASSQTSDTKASAPRSLDTTAPVLWQPSMNVFRRFAAPKEKMFEFYGVVLGFKQLTTLNVNTGGGGVARFQAGGRRSGRDGVAAAYVLLRGRGRARGSLRCRRLSRARVRGTA
jgi:hypothetical protein